MRIEELIIEGFKSYPQRTQISGWDASFNAITGLNGSGKSNILDAICFVLGMTNMQTMRAQSQADLVYKRGQAGITKASVTIVFDNSDKQHPGYQDTPQITVTRQFSLPSTTKWLLNGHKTTQQQILSFFQALQLNINNPNFLIMQGRITKVLNMRPAEILGMIEEASGTRMFEEKKSKAQKTMSKKEKKVDEITELLKTEIEPKLDKLRGEKRNYVEYQKCSAELEKVGRVLRAWEWFDARKKVGEKEEEIKRAKEQRKEVEGDMKKAIKECQQAEKDMAEVLKKRDQEMKKGGRLTKLKEKADSLGKEVVKVRTQAEIKQGTIEEEEKSLLDVQEEINTLEESIANERECLAGLTTAHNALQEKHATFQSSVLKSEELLQTLLTGVAASSGSNSTTANTARGGGYLGQLAETKSLLAQAQAEEEQTKVKLGIAQTELEGLKKKMKELDKEMGEGKKKVESMKKIVEDVRAKVGKCGWDKEREDKLEARLKEVRGRVRELTDKRERIKQTLSRLSFEYTDPYPGFDKSKIKGYIAQLTSLDQRHYDKATALEIVAGGKLFNLVVEDEQVGNALLKNGRLRKRVTMIPLNKIKAWEIDQKKIDLASRLAPGKAYPAISLVGYPQDLAKAMLFVFGGTFICADSSTARTITFNRDIFTRSVTLDGDVYDPQGSLSGGSSPSGNKVLIDVQALIEVESELQKLMRELREIEGEEERVRGVREEWKRLGRELEIREHEWKLVNDQVGGSNASRILGDVTEAEKNLQELKNTLQAARDKQNNAKAECKRLEKDMNEFKNNKEGKIAELKKEISKKKAELQKHATIVKTQQKEHQTAVLELEQQETDLERAKSKFEDARTHISTLKKDLVKMSEEVTTMQAKHQEAEATLLEEQATLGRFDAELKSLEEVIKARKATVTNCEIEIEKLEHDVGSFQKEKVTAEHRMKNLDEAHAWIQMDKHLFGQANTPYDFNKADIDQLRSKANEIEKSQEGRKKKLNEKVMNMIDTLERREGELRKMLTTVMKDKGKIEATIEELDRHKRDALHKTWEKVNADFGSIFRELLPGNFAKLQPPEGQDLTQGLEVKVQLGTVWKQSLTELSGGQRSLIALSLIMALLQFKPAPMYILDEIDAALDLSHTQNIGQLFRTRFKGSQFIVVSLKEGLFTNANVLFKAKFRDGTSVVERTAQRSSSTLYA